MKRILLTLSALAFAATLGAGTAHAESFSSSNSGSCSGRITGWGYYYAYTYQYAYVANGMIANENHNFNFHGFLDDADDPRFVEGRDNTWMVYRSGDFDIAVPYIEDAGLFVRDNRDRDNDWVKLCSY